MINGATAMYFIVGHPISQVKSPANFNAVAAQHGLNAALAPLNVRPAQIETFFQTLRGLENVGGIVVTVPFKQIAAQRADVLSDTARDLGAANVIRRYATGALHGDNVDGQGFLQALAGHAIEPSSRSALVIGAGGVGGAIAYALCGAGVRAIALVDCDEARRDRLADLLRAKFPGVAVSCGYERIAAFDLVVNATPIGMKGDDPLPAEFSEIAPGAHFADVVTAPAETPFLLHARALGASIQTGPEMALGQLKALAAGMGLRLTAIEVGD